MGLVAERERADVQVVEVQRAAAASACLQLGREHVAHPLQALEHLRAVGAVAQDRARALVERAPGDLAGGLVARDPDRHARVHDARHRPDAAGVVVGRRAGSGRPRRASSASAGVPATPSSHSAEPSAARIGGHMRAGSIGGPACVTPPLAWCARDLRGRDDIDHQRARRSQPRDRIRFCMQRCVHEVATLNRRARPCNRTGGHNRDEPWTGGPRERSRGRPTLRPVGLYDPAYEHDSCGVACLARLDGQPAHETISRAIETLDNLEHRGAEGADAETGDGAGILTQIPDAFLRAELDFALPPAGEYAVAVCMLPREPTASAAETVIERLVQDGGQRVLGWRDVPVDASVPGPGRAGARCRSSASSSIGSDERRPGRVRAPPVRHPAAGRARAGRRGRVPELLVAHDGAQGDAGRAAAAALLQGPVRPAVRQRAGDRALALLDQHVPELGARAPVPLHRAQRRDQHAARQRQLDARARALAGRVLRGAAGDPVRRVAIPRASTPCSSCSCSRAGRSRTR